MTPEHFEVRLYEILRHRDPLWIAEAERNNGEGGYTTRGQLSREESNLFEAISALYRETLSVSVEQLEAALQRTQTTQSSAL